MPYRFYTADVFTNRPFGGNPLAVLPAAQGLALAQMQQIAREFNLSETVFVLPPENPQHTCRLRIFTPGGELPFAGHPTVGTAYVLALIGAIPLAAETTPVVFEEGVGPVAVTIRARDGQPVFAQLTAARLPEWGPAPPPAGTLAAVLGLDEADLLGGDDAPVAISCGVPFLFVPLRSLDAVQRARLDLARWEATLAQFWAPQVYLFTHETVQPESTLHARMFSPSMGIVEDPATGAAAAALGGYLGRRLAAPDGTGRWQVEQGFEMGRPSLLEVEVDTAAGAVTAVRVGGQAVLISEGQLTVPGEE